MLASPTPFPLVGSFALYEDPDLPIGQRMAELVRIIEKGQSTVLIGFALRENVASSNRRVAIAELHDGTELTAAEKVELTDIDRQLFDRRIRTPRQKALDARRDELRSRLWWSGLLLRQLERLERQQRAMGRAA